jgi:3-phosphoshikimate 1-carboxyvinyltransferase
MNELKTIIHLPKGAVKVPPSKSMAHRAIICSALAEGESIIENINLSEDIQATLRCVESLGVEYKYKDNVLTIQGGIKLPREKILLDCGESGSTLRFFIAIASIFSTPISLTGSSRLMERPLGPYLEALHKQGVSIDKQGDVLTICGPLKGGDFFLPGDISSQFVTGLLLALPLVKEDSRIILSGALESKSYVDLTLQVMEHFGVHVKCGNHEQYTISGQQKYRPQDFSVEGDYSNAAFFLIAGALGREVECLGLNEESRQGDKAILDILKSCGANITKGSEGGIQVTPGDLKAITVDVHDIPDLVPPLAVLLCFCRGNSRIINAGRLRIKESDRLHAVTEELNSLGAKIEEGPDYLVIQGIQELRGGIVDSHNDHRIAMSVALAAIKSRGEVQLTGASAVNKSYPGFWGDFCKEERRKDHE